MRHAAVMVLGMASAAAAVAAETWPKESKTRSSANGLYAIRFVQVDETKCRVEAMKDRDVAWTLDRCLATVDDVLLINNEGNRFWVLKVLPEIPDAPKDMIFVDGK